MPEERRIHIYFSNSWVGGFKNRHGFRSYSSHDESGEADEESIRARMPVIRQKISKYYNEYGHFFQMSSSRTKARNALPDKKKQKKRLTYLANCNAVGSQKHLFMIIGNARKTRAFDKKTGCEHVFDY